MLLFPEFKGWGTGLKTEWDDLTHSHTFPLSQDPTFKNILNFNVGHALDLEVPQVCGEEGRTNQRIRDLMPKH